MTLGISGQTASQIEGFLVLINISFKCRKVRSQSREEEYKMYGRSRQGSSSLARFSAIGRI